MALHVTKYHLAPNNSIFTEIITMRRSIYTFIYGALLIFVFFTIFIAFTPTPSSSNPWVITIFTFNSSSPSINFNEESYRSHFSSIFSYIFPNSSDIASKNLSNTQEPPDKGGIAENHTVKSPQAQIRSNNRTESKKVHNFDQNSTRSQAPASNFSQNGENKGKINEKNVKEKVGKSDLVASLSRKQGKHMQNGSVLVGGGKEGDDLVASLVDCDFYDGYWVRDESYPLYKTESCPLLDEQFRCVLNGRSDTDYQKLKWKPKGCSLPRLNAADMLQRLRGKRLVFVGDSLNRNMWESLVCILRNSVKNKERVYEAFGRHYFKTGASYSFVFKDYNCTVEFFVTPFLVQQWDVQDKNGGEAKETLRIDLMVKDSIEYKDADFLIFNTGHWWTHDKISKGEDYYQEGSHVYKQLDVTEAFRRAITTWGRWIDANVNSQKTHVFFRGYSASHFSGGQWNSGGSCDRETELIKNDTYLMPYPWKMQVLERVMKGMKTPVSYLNVTKMTDYRKDGHPSRFRKQNSFDLQIQDCSHWCLPGVPDLWNELLYAEILRKQYKDRIQKTKT